MALKQCVPVSEPGLKAFFPTNRNEVPFYLLAALPSPCLQLSPPARLFFTVIECGCSSLPQNACVGTKNCMPWLLNSEPLSFGFLFVQVERTKLFMCAKREQVSASVLCLVLNINRRYQMSLHLIWEYSALSKPY